LERRVNFGNAGILRANAVLAIEEIGLEIIIYKGRIRAIALCAPNSCGK